MAFSPLSLWERARVRVSALKLDHLQTGTLAMPTALYRLILALLLWLPLAAHADDASDFAAANLPQQVKLLESWAAQPDPARTELIMALQHGQITVDGQPKTVRLNNRLRGLIDTALASHQLLSADPTLRLSAAQQLQ